MKGKFVAKCFFAVILGAGALLAVGYIFMMLWNGVIPAVFGLKTITYCQAFGLLILGKLLFGGFRGKWGGRCGSCCHSGNRSNWRGRWESKWSEMTPEEREKIKKGFGGRCGFNESNKEEAARD